MFFTACWPQSSPNIQSLKRKRKRRIRKRIMSSWGWIDSNASRGYCAIDYMSSIGEIQGDNRIAFSD